MRYAYYFPTRIDRSGEHANKILHYTRETGTYRASESPRLRCVKRQNVYRNAIHLYMRRTRALCFKSILYSFRDLRVSYGPQRRLPAPTTRRAIFPKSRPNARACTYECVVHFISAVICADEISDRRLGTRGVGGRVNFRHANRSTAAPGADVTAQSVDGASINGRLQFEHAERRQPCAITEFPIFVN